MANFHSSPFTLHPSLCWEFAWDAVWVEYWKTETMKNVPDTFNSPHWGGVFSIGWLGLRFLGTGLESALT